METIKYLNLGIVAFSFLALVACQNSGNHMPIADVHTEKTNLNLPMSAGGVFYTTDILPMVQKNCIACHGPGSGHDWTDYGTFKSKQSQIEVRVLGPAANMPMGGKLAESDKALLQAWIDEGMPYAPPQPSVPSQPSPGGSPSAPGPTPNPGPVPEPVPAPHPGQHVYYRPHVLDVIQRNCIACHGPGAPRNWTDYATFKAARAVILVRVLGPAANMPMGAKLSDTDKATLQSWIDEDMPEAASTPEPAPGPTPGPAPEPAPAPTPAPVGPSQVQTCIGCHGDSGHSTNPMFPILAGQSELYLRQQLAAFKDHSRNSEDAQNFMWPIVQDLTPNDFKIIARFFTKQRPSVAVPGDAPDQNKLRLGKRIYVRGTLDTTACTLCHQQSGQGNYDVMPRIGGQDHAYIQKQLHNFQNGLRKSDKGMEGIVKRMTAEEIEAVSIYISTLGRNGQ